MCLNPKFNSQAACCNMLIIKIKIHSFHYKSVILTIKGITYSFANLMKAMHVISGKSWMP